MVLGRLSRLGLSWALVSLVVQLIREEKADGEGSIQ